MPGPMSRTMPEAVLRSGGIRAEEPDSSGSTPGTGVGAFFSKKSEVELERAYVSGGWRVCNSQMHFVLVLRGMGWALL